MKIGTLSRRSGIEPGTIRFYESLGLLSPTRTEGGTRLYGEDDLTRLSTIRSLSSLGLPLPTITPIAQAYQTSATGDEAAHKAVYHLSRLKGALEEKRAVCEALLAKVAGAEADVKACFRCKDRPTAQICGGCDRRPLPHPLANPPLSA